MTNQVNQAFVKRREIEGYILSDGTPNNEDYGVSRDWFQYGYEAATQATKSEINSLKERVEELQTHLSNQVIVISLSETTLEAYAHKIAELQADNNRLREALEVCKYDCHTGEVIGIAEKALKATQSCEML